MSKHVAVLMGGWSAERDVSLRSGTACAAALVRLGYRVSPIDVARDIAAGKCDLGVANTYYWALMLNKEPDRKAWAEATKVILGDSQAPPRILVVTTFDQDEHVFAALRGGASG